MEQLEIAENCENLSVAAGRGKIWEVGKYRGKLN